MSYEPTASGIPVYYPPATYRHASGDEGGCGACGDENVDALLSGYEPPPVCREPADDGDGYCATCGHTVEAVA